MARLSPVLVEFDRLMKIEEARKTDFAEAADGTSMLISAIAIQVITNAPPGREDDIRRFFIDTIRKRLINDDEIIEKNEFETLQ